MGRLDSFLEKIRDSEAYQQVKVKYDELDSQTKLYVNLGALGALVFLVFLTLLVSIARLDLLKSEINDREETIGYLQRSADTIKELQAKQRAGGGSALSGPVSAFVQSLLMTNAITPEKAEIGAEHAGAQLKDSTEMLVDVKLNQVNIKQIQDFLFAVTDQGAARGINIRDLDIDTKSDPSGWMDATVTLSSYKAK